MATVTVPALKPLTYRGRSYVRGELVPMRAIDAAAAAQAGQVSLARGVTITDGYRTREMGAEPEAVPVRTRRRYRRRDMTAEGAGE